MDDNYYHVKICLCNGHVGYICEMRLNPRCVGVKRCPLKAKNFIWHSLVRVLPILCVRETLCDVNIICLESPFSVYWTLLLYSEPGTQNKSYETRYNAGSLLLGKTREKHLKGELVTSKVNPSSIQCPRIDGRRLTYHRLNSQITS